MAPPQTPVARVVQPQEKALGGFSVRRILPGANQRSVGPFVFFDHMGPADFPPGKGIDVRPHPHIGLSTLTYLFEGEIMHRDSLGSVQAIRPGAVNLMTAGRGIVHSERSGPDREEQSRLHGIQVWMALPEALEEMEPNFVHYDAKALPVVERDGATIRVVCGAAFGERSPVHEHSPTLYLDVWLPQGARIELPADIEELAVYTVTGVTDFDGLECGPGQMVIANQGALLNVGAVKDSRVIVIGGEPLGKRYVWWNLVSSTRDRIEQAKQDWKAGRFESVPGDDEFIPLPED
jgi:redox-sensitive bicupin YhaK (pirin superfamily)